MSSVSKSDSFSASADQSAGTAAHPPAPRVRKRHVVPPPPPPPVLPAQAGVPVLAPTESATESATKPPWSLRSVPSWLVSLAVHLLALVLLALGTVAARPPIVGTLITSVFADETEPLLQVEELRLETIEEVQPLESDVEAVELTMQDLTAGMTGAAVTDVGEVELDAVSEVGDLFVGGAPGLADRGDGHLKAAEFFGVKATGRKFVFIVDSSQSLRKGKFDAAKKELEYAIRRLSPDQLFYVIFFDQDAARMHFPDEMLAEANAAPATTTNINRMVRWMHTVKTELRTDPYEAVKFALSLDPDAIYILSDGKFTDKGKTVRYLQNTNVIDDPEQGYRPRAVIHTIAFWQRDGEETMKAIARTHRGTYRFVPPEAE